MKPRLFVLAAALLMLLSGSRSTIGAQSRTDWASFRNTVSVLAGGFIYDPADDGSYMYSGIRVGHQLSPHFEVELGGGYARIARTRFNAPATSQMIVHAPFYSLDASLHAQLPLGRFAPYVGMGAGYFERGEGDAYSSRIGGPSVSALGGMKFLVNKHVALRGEFKFRSDDHHFGQHSRDFEQVAGLSISF